MKIIAWACWAYMETIHRTLSIRGNDIIAHWAYEEQIFANAQPAVKCEQFLHVQFVHPCWAYTEQISSHTEHTQNEFHCTLSIRGMDFIARWAYKEIFKSQIYRPNQLRFSKNLCYGLYKNFKNWVSEKKS